MGSRFLARLDSNGLREHVKGNRFLSERKLTVTAKTVHVLQESLLMAHRADEYGYCLRISVQHKYAEGFRQGVRNAIGTTVGAMRTKVCSRQKPTASCTLMR
jgi:hypothetical protein